MSAHPTLNLAFTAITGAGALVAANYYISPTSPRHHGSYKPSSAKSKVNANHPTSPVLEHLCLGIYD
jgi:hypothetical protein